MLWCQGRRALRQPVRRGGGKGGLLPQDVAHSFISNKTGQQTQALCPRTDSPAYGPHGLGGPQHHGAEPRGHQHAGRQLGQWGVGAAPWAAAAPLHPPRQHPAAPGPADWVPRPSSPFLQGLWGKIEDGPESKQGHNCSFLWTKKAVKWLKFLTPFYTLCFNVWRFYLLSFWLGFVCLFIFCTC